MASTATRPTQRAWRIPARPPITAPRPGRHVVTHRRRRPRPVWLHARLDRLPWYLPPAPYTLTDAAAAEMFDNTARRELGVSGAEFVRRWEAGEYADATDDDPQGRRVLHVAYLIPFFRAGDLRS